MGNEQDRSSGPRRVLRRVPGWMVSALTVAVLLTALEGVYRIHEGNKRTEMLAGKKPANLRTQPADPPQYYELKPDVPHFTNSAGFRDLERQVQKPSRVYRVAVIGDSVSMQGKLPFESLYVRHLQRRLAADFGGRVEMLNFAITGYNTTQEASVLTRKALSYAPDLVLWQIHDNDGNHPVYESERGRYYHRPRSYFARFLGMRIDHLRKRMFIRREGLQDASTEEQNMLFRWDRVTGDIGRVAELLRSRNIGLLVFLYPRWPEGNDWKNYGEAGYEIHRAFAAELAVLGITVVDLLPRFTELDPARLRSKPSDPWHPSAEGHIIIAEELMPALRDLMGSRI